MRRRRFRRNPDDLDELLNDPGLQAIAEEGRKFEREQAEIHKSIRASFKQGLSPQAYELIRAGLDDQEAARRIYNRLNRELQEKLPRADRRTRVEARRALEEMYGVNSLRDFSRATRTESDGPPPSRVDWPTGLPYFTARRYRIQSKPIYRGVQRQLRLEREYEGIDGQLEADRALARAILEKKYELDRMVQKSRSEVKRAEYLQQIVRLKEIAENFINSRREMWELARGQFAPEMGVTVRSSQKVQQAKKPDPSLGYFVGQKLMGTRGDYLDQELEVMAVTPEFVTVKTAKAKEPVVLSMRQFKRYTAKL